MRNRKWRDGQGKREKKKNRKCFCFFIEIAIAMRETLKPRADSLCALVTMHTVQYPHCRQLAVAPGLPSEKFAQTRKKEGQKQ